MLCFSKNGVLYELQQKLKFFIQVSINHLQLTLNLENADSMFELGSESFGAVNLALFFGGKD